MNIKRKKLVVAMLCCGITSTITVAKVPDEAISLDILNWTNAGVSINPGTAYVAEDSQLEGTDLYIRNVNVQNQDSVALYMEDKNSSLKLTDDSLNTGDATFNSTVIAAYTNNNSGIAIKIGDNNFSLNEQPQLNGTSVDLFSDKIGIEANSAQITLKNSLISALDTAIIINDDGGKGSTLNFDNVSVKFNAEQFNKVISDAIGDDSVIVAETFKKDQKAKNGIDVIGTGNAGETVVTIKNSTIDVQKTAIYASNAATVNVDNTHISSHENTGAVISINGKDTNITIANSNINTNSAGIDVTNNAKGLVDNSVINRQKGGYGVSARYDAELAVQNTNINMTGAGINGTAGFSPAAVSARDHALITLKNVTINDQVDAANRMKGIYADLGGKVIGDFVSYNSASKGAYGVQIVDTASVDLKNSKFDLTGEQSVGVFAAGGTFNADNSQFSSLGPLIRIYENSADSSVIQITNGSQFKSDSILLQNDLPPKFMDPTDDRIATLNADKSILSGRIIGGIGATDVTLTNGTVWSYSGTSNMRNLTLNNAHIQLNQPQGSQYNILEVDKLNSTNSVIELWTEFNGDDSKTDIIRINEEATGKTGLSFKNSGGIGAQTNVGIKVVDAVDQGPWGPKATTTNDAFYIDASSDGYRNGHNSIATGAYEYFLVKSQKGQEGIDESWYLRSEKLTGPIIEPIIRPEVISYLSNNQMASALQRHKWQDRKGQMNESNGTDMGWVRVQSNKSSFNDKFGSTRKSTSNLIHFGLDVLQHNLADNGRLDIGVMGLLGAGETKVHINNMSSKATLDSYNIGAYATWQQSADGKEGAYIDTWVMHGWNKNHVKGNGLADEKYNSQMTSLSLEVGYNFMLSSAANQAWYIQPQAQIIWSKGNNKHHFEQSTKTDIRWDNASDISARVGMHLASDITLDSGTQISPFVDLNYWHNPKDQYMQFGNERIKDELSSSAVELAAGLQGKINNSVHIWGNVGVQKGKRDYKDLKGQIGVTIKW